MTNPRTHAVVHARRRPPIVAILLAAAALVLVSPNPAHKTPPPGKAGREGEATVVLVHGT